MKKRLETREYKDLKTKYQISWFWNELLTQVNGLKEETQITSKHLKTTHIFIHQENADSNYFNIPSRPHQNGHHHKHKQQMLEVEKTELLYTDSGSIS